MPNVGVREPAPDYLALVLECECEEPVEDTLLTLLTRPEPLPRPEPRPEPLTRPELPTRGSRVLRALAVSVGALGALAAAGWGIHKLREA